MHHIDNLLCYVTFRINILVVLDGLEVIVTGLFAGVLAVMVTLGKNETCKSLEKFSSDYGFP